MQINGLMESDSSIPILSIERMYVGSRGVGLSRRFVEELCQRGIRISFYQAAAALRDDHNHLC